MQADNKDTLTHHVLNRDTQKYFHKFLHNSYNICF